jgi:sialate O-acetylesterase
MKKTNKLWARAGIKVLAFGSVMVGMAVPAGAEVRLPKIFGDHMVLQRERPVPVWGWAEPGEKITVRFGGASVHTTADAKGKWLLKLPALPATAEGRELSIAGSNTLAFKDVVVGEVWLCGGQSNMDFGLGGALNAEQEIKDAKYPAIRHFRTEFAAPAEPAEDCRGQWAVCSPETAGGFTAVGYFFGRRIHQEVGVPVGLITAAAGGTPVESWTGKQMMQAEPEFGAALKQLDETLAGYPAAKQRYEAERAARDEKMRAPIADQGWETPALDEGDWKEMAVPKNWEDNGLHLDGCVWLRKTVSIPDSWAGKELTLSLGPVDNADITYWNGTKVGGTDNYKLDRSYTVPAAVVKAGKTVIAVRVYDTDGYGGINGKPEQLFMAVAGQNQVSLAGPWKYQVAFVIPGWPQEPMGPGNAFLPGSLYNGMIAPHVPYGIKGAIWYQGEGNERDQPNSYYCKMRGMINGWRSVWGMGDFPFYFTQIANFRGPCEDPAGDDGVHWATVRQSQLKTLGVKNTGMAVAIDLADPGNPGDIHPKDKQDVGDRLALWALAKDYGRKNLVYSGPLYKGMKVEGGKIRIGFDCIGGGLMVGAKEGIKPTVELKDAKLQTFAIAGDDRKWHWADAAIDGNTVLVSCPAVAKPVAVRYAYSMNPVGNKLYNKYGLPASPFRTDEW